MQRHANRSQAGERTRVIRELCERRLQSNFRRSIRTEIAGFARLSDASVSERGERDDIIRFFLYPAFPARGLGFNRSRICGDELRWENANQRTAKHCRETA